MFQAKNFDSLLGIPGLSDTLLKNHFTLYQGYVTNVNKLIDIIHLMVKEGKTSTPEFAEINRRFGWEFNGMRLHELYFANLKRSSSKMDIKLSNTITESFGSLENWEKHFKSLGTMRGIGWVLLVYDTESKKLLNIWVNEHDLGLLADSKILLVMDVFEHSYMIDYGLKKADYIETFFKNIDWSTVEKRF